MPQYITSHQAKPVKPKNDHNLKDVPYGMFRFQEYCYFFHDDPSSFRSWRERSGQYSAGCSAEKIPLVPDKGGIRGMG